MLFGIKLMTSLIQMRKLPLSYFMKENFTLAQLEGIAWNPSIIWANFLFPVLIVRKLKCEEKNIYWEYIFSILWSFSSMFNVRCLSIISGCQPSVAWVASVCFEMITFEECRDCGGKAGQFPSKTQRGPQYSAGRPAIPQAQWEDSKLITWSEHQL